MAGFLENRWESVFFFLLKDNLIDLTGRKTRLREIKGAAARLNIGTGGRDCHGSGDLSFVFTSDKNQLCDLASHLWTSVFSSVHERGGLHSSFQCVCWLLPRTRNKCLHYNPAYTHKHMYTHVTQTIASQNNAYYMQSLCFVFPTLFYFIILKILVLTCWMDFTIH